MGVTYVSKEEIAQMRSKKFSALSLPERIFLLDLRVKDLEKRLELLEAHHTEPEEDEE